MVFESATAMLAVDADVTEDDGSTEENLKTGPAKGAGATVEPNMLPVEPPNVLVPVPESAMLVEEVERTVTPADTWFVSLAEAAVNEKTGGFNPNSPFDAERI